MNWQNILTVYLKELKDSLRDRRTLISMIVVPTLIMPIIMFGVGTIMTKIMKQAQSETVSVMILGAADSPGVVATLKADRKFRLVPESADYQQLISDKKVRVAVALPAGFEAALKSGEVQTISLYYYEGELKSGFGLKAVQDFFTSLKEKTIETRLADRGLPAAVIKPFVIRKQNVAPPEKVGGNAIGGFIPYLIIILCFTGAMYPAMDLTAGEKERGTMETLLCSPVHRINIVVGKFLMVLTASLTTVLLSIVSMGVSAAIGVMYFGGTATSQSATAAMVGKAAEGSSIPLIDPVGLIGVAFTISLFAKSYKEAQSYISPLIVVVIMPAVIGMLPGVELNAKLALVPILNLSLVCKEMLSGVWHWPYIALIFGSSCLYAAIALGFAVKMFNREDVIFRA